MTENEMMETMKKIEVYQKKSLLHKRLITAFLAVIMVAVLVVVPSVISTLHSAQTVMANMNITIGKMDVAIDSITDLTETAGGDMQEALNQLTSIDIETLNDAIKDLSDVVEPLAGFFGRFK